MDNVHLSAASAHQSEDAQGGQIALSCVRLRPIAPGDASRLMAFGHGLSRDSRYQRFFSLREVAPDEFVQWVNPDPAREAAVVATVNSGHRVEIVGVARYAANSDRTSVDFAVVVADAWQHHGLGRALIERVLAIARSRGFAAISGLVLATNYAMQRLALKLGFSLHRDPADATVLQLFLPLKAGLH